MWTHHHTAVRFLVLVIIAGIYKGSEDGMINTTEDKTLMLSSLHSPFFSPEQRAEPQAQKRQLKVPDILEKQHSSSLLHQAEWICLHQLWKNPLLSQRNEKPQTKLWSSQTCHVQMVQEMVEV